MIRQNIRSFNHTLLSLVRMRWCSCCKKRNIDDGGFQNGYREDDEVNIRTGKHSLAIKILKWTAIVLTILLILGFLIIFVVLPLIFMNTISIQRFLMFPNFDQPENPEYTNYAKYGAKGVRNIYATVTDLHNSSRALSLGIWQVVPEKSIEEAEKPGFDFDEALRNSEKPIVIYFHGQSGTRIFPLPTYNVLRKYFHVIAWDYRSYGDSTEALLTELGVVSDAKQLYTWVINRTNQKNIYIWGHSLGTALSTHTVKQLTYEKVNPLPKALILEAPFTTMRDEVSNHPIGKLFAWLVWFNATILDPLEYNGFLFKTTTNILDVKCPVMVLHAEDDSVIPVELGRQVYETARDKRQGLSKEHARFHRIPEVIRADHMGINKYPKLPQLIGDFVEYVG